MLVEFLRGDGEDAVVVGTVRWAPDGISVASDDDTVNAGLERAFRRTPVAIDDASFRRWGTHGEVVVQPGDLEWFRAVAIARVPAETGLRPRFVPGPVVGGYDPASNYRSFGDQVERLSARAARQR